MDAVVVTGSRTEQRMRDALPHVTVITPREIRDSQAVDLPSLLRTEAGFEFTQNGGAGALTGIFMRGGRSAQALILVDGVRVEDAGFGTTAIQHLMLDQVERIEVVRGNVSSLYGSGAIGGVVQVFTRRGQGAPSGTVEALLGARGTSRYGATFGGQAGDTRFHVAASQFATDGYSSIDTRVAPNANPDRDGYRNLSGSASLSHRFSGQHEAGINWLATQGRLAFDSAFATRTTEHTSAQDLESISGWWEARPNDLWKSRFVASQGTDFRTDYTNNARANFSNTRSRQFSWDNDFRVHPEHVVSVGLESLRQTIANSAFTRLLARNVGVGRLGYVGRVDAHSFQANFRTEDYSDFGGANTHLLAYGYDLTPEWKLIASKATSFRAPTFQDLYGFGGNLALRPERTRTGEAGFQWAEGPHRVRFVAFSSRYEDSITFSAGATRNVRNANVAGYEASYAGRVLGTDLRASVTLQDPVEQEPNAPELQAIRRATQYGSLSAQRDFGPVRAGAEVVNSGPRADTHIVSGARVQDAGYTVVNFTARWQIEKALHLSARLENAFDRQYQLVNGYNTPGRGLFVSLGWQGL